jgi:hypothetical protein
MTASLKAFAVGLDIGFQLIVKENVHLLSFGTVVILTYIVKGFPIRH